MKAEPVPLVNCLLMNSPVGDLVYQMTGIDSWVSGLQRTCKELSEVKNVLGTIEEIVTIHRRGTRLLTNHNDLLTAKSYYKFLMRLQTQDPSMSPYILTDKSVFLSINTHSGAMQHIVSLLNTASSVGIDSDAKFVEPRRRVNDALHPISDSFGARAVSSTVVGNPGAYTNFYPATHVLVDTVGYTRTKVRRIVSTCAKSATIKVILVSVPETDVKEKERLLFDCGLLPGKLEYRKHGEDGLFLYMRVYVDGARGQDYHYVYGFVLSPAVRTRIQLKTSRCPALPELTSRRHNLTYALGINGEVQVPCSFAAPSRSKRARRDQQAKPTRAMQQLMQAKKLANEKQALKAAVAMTQQL
jgi:hypothetical protein